MRNSVYETFLAARFLSLNRLLLEWNSQPKLKKLSRSDHFDSPGSESDVKL